LHVERLVAPIPRYDDYPFNCPDSLPHRRVAHLAAQPELGLWSIRRPWHSARDSARAVFVAHHLA